MSAPPIESPLFSVVMPSHNRPDLLSEAVQSVVAQTETDWELIVVDDASVPPISLAIGDPRIRILRNSRSQGGAAAKEKGLAQTDGHLIAFLDDDDLYAPNYLESAGQVFKGFPELDVLFTGVEWFGSRADAGRRAYDRAMDLALAVADGKWAEPDLVLFERNKLFLALLRTVPMAFQRPVVRRRALKRIGGFKADVLLWDCDWALRAVLEGRCGLLARPLYRQRAEGQGSSSLAQRRDEHFKSNVLMKERLLLGLENSPIATAVRKSVADLWFDAAWGHSEAQNFRNAIHCLRKSANAYAEFRQLKLLGQIVFKFIRTAGTAR